MPYGLIIALVITAIAAIALAVAIFKIKQGLEGLSRDLFGTSSFKKGIDEQKRKVNSYPRSLQAMTRLELPRIMKDFPEFDYADYKEKTHALLRSFFNALEKKQPEMLTGECSPALKGSVTGIIEELESSDYSQVFNEVVIHKTEISKYVKDGVTATITFVTAVGHYSYILDSDGKLVHGEKDMSIQTVYETDLVYVQDVDKINTQGSALGVNCPNCGAPIKNLGQKFCEYCGTGITEVNIRSWKFDAIREQTTNKKFY